jgi:stringent starvation protein B
MSSSRPYLIRAFYEWIVDNNCTPHILINADIDGVDVPREHIKDGQIVLNISPTAVQNLLINNEAIEFDGRFSGAARSVYAPVDAIMGIYSRENGQGMVFEAEGLRPDPTDPDGGGSPTRRESPAAEPKPGKPKKPALRVVK